MSALDVVLSLDDWRHPADETDLAMLALCEGPTIDVGCGPGRLTEALTLLGHVVLGIDVTHEAVGHTVERGGSALRRDVFSPLPAEGRWFTALLADGNIGIGGDPVALLQRLSHVLDPRGRIVVELDPPGTRLRHGWATLHDRGRVADRFPWSVVGVDDVEEVAREAGMHVAAVVHHAPRWFAVVEVPR